MMSVMSMMMMMAMSMMSDWLARLKSTLKVRSRL